MTVERRLNATCVPGEPDASSGTPIRASGDTGSECECSLRGASLTELSLAEWDGSGRLVAVNLPVACWTLQRQAGASSSVADRSA